MSWVDKATINVAEAAAKDGKKAAVKKAAEEGAKQAAKVVLKAAFRAGAGNRYARK